MEHLTLWGQFAVGALLVIVAGVRLVKLGDVLSEKLGLGQAFIGMIFVALVTSLPELAVTGDPSLASVPSALALTVAKPLMKPPVQL